MTAIEYESKNTTDCPTEGMLNFKELVENTPGSYWEKHTKSQFTSERRMPDWIWFSTQDILFDRWNGQGTVEIIERSGKNGLEISQLTVEGYNTVW